MKNEILERVGVTLTALNNISVSGKANLANLSGSIMCLEEIAGILQNAEVVLCDSKKENTK